MPKTAYPMTPLDTSRTTRWAAYSADGVWAYERGEEVGTPWHVHHLPTGRVLEYAATSLPKARRGTAAGWVLTDLARQDATRAADAAAAAVKAAA